MIAFLNIIITIQITSSVLIWVYKPFEPLEKLQIIIIKIFNFLLNIPIYNYRIIIRNYNYKDIVNILNLLKSLKRLIEIFREKIKKITLRENILIYFSVVFLLLFIIVLFGYGGAIYSLNRFDGIYNKYILFKDLPPNSSYFKSIFQSFVIMISGQDITLGNTTVLGRIIYIFEVFNMLFLFGFILTVFFTSVNFKDNIYSNNLDSVFETILKKLSEVIDDIEGSLKPMILNKENIKYD
ncbi:hypothetical protein LLG96_09320 [bacterium]|nr:hypothetical protein [bacterium]